MIPFRPACAVHRPAQRRRPSGPRGPDRPAAIELKRRRTALSLTANGAARVPMEAVISSWPTPAGWSCARRISPAQYLFAAARCLFRCEHRAAERGRREICDDVAPAGRGASRVKSHTHSQPRSCDSVDSKPIDPQAPGLLNVSKCLRFRSRRWLTDSTSGDLAGGRALT